MSSSVLNRELLTVRQVAAELRLSEKTVRRLIASGELPAFRLGRKGASVRVDRDELEAWLGREPEAE
jgi:excisionase family DNA binding protein